MKSFGAEATRAALPFPALIGALASLFAQGCEVPQRHQHMVGEQLTTLIMPAWIAGRYLGIKTVNIAPGNAALAASYLLYDANTGVPLALMDGNEITARRTAAASALAASRLARADAQTLLVVGAGQVARLLPEAYRAALPHLQQIWLWHRKPATALALAAQLREQGLPVAAIDELATAVRQADIVSCATLTTSPLIQGAWLQPGSHLDLIGSFTPAMREADDACFAGASLWVDTEEALRKSGDLLAPLASGVLRPQDLRGTLADLCRQPGGGRQHTSERTVFKSVGTALEDLAAAMLVYEAA